MEADNAPMEDEVAPPSSPVRVGFTIGEARAHYTAMELEERGAKFRLARADQAYNLCLAQADQAYNLRHLRRAPTLGGATCRRHGHGAERGRERARGAGRLLSHCAAGDTFSIRWICRPPTRR